MFEGRSVIVIARSKQEPLKNQTKLLYSPSSGVPKYLNKPLLLLHLKLWTNYLTCLTHTHRIHTTAVAISDDHS